MGEIAKDLPAWFGSVPQWGMFILLLIAVVRTSPQWLESLIKAAQARRDRTQTRITELEKAVKECQDECAKQTQVLNDTIRDLEEQMHGMRRQHIQEQISLVNAIIESVDNPLLKKMLGALESVRQNLPVVAIDEGAEDDIQGA